MIRTFALSVNDAEILKVCHGLPFQHNYSKKKIYCNRKAILFCGGYGRFSSRICRQFKMSTEIFSLRHTIREGKAEHRFALVYTMMCVDASTFCRIRYCVLRCFT